MGDKRKICLPPLTVPPATDWPVMGLNQVEIKEPEASAKFTVTVPPDGT